MMVLSLKPYGLSTSRFNRGSVSHAIRWQGRNDGTRADGALMEDVLPLFTSGSSFCFENKSRYSTRSR